MIIHMTYMFMKEDTNVFNASGNCGLTVRPILFLKIVPHVFLTSKTSLNKKLFFHYTKYYCYSIQTINLLNILPLINANKIMVKVISDECESMHRSILISPFEF